jgi:hypothetical protein
MVGGQQEGLRGDRRLCDFGMVWMRRRSGGGSWRAGNGVEMLFWTDLLLLGGVPLSGRY